MANNNNNPWLDFILDLIKKTQTKELKWDIYMPNGNYNPSDLEGGTNIFSCIYEDAKILLYKKCQTNYITQKPIILTNGVILPSPNSNSMQYCLIILEETEKTGEAIERQTLQNVLRDLYSTVSFNKNSNAQKILNKFRNKKLEEETA